MASNIKFIAGLRYGEEGVHRVWFCTACNRTNRMHISVCSCCSKDHRERCYIAGKIGDLPKEVWERNFNAGIAAVEALGYVAVSPTNLPHKHERTWIAYMREDLHALIDCDAVYCLRNWRDSPGAKVEINLALQLGLVVLHEQMLPKSVEV